MSFIVRTQQGRSADKGYSIQQGHSLNPLNGFIYSIDYPVGISLCFL